MSFELQNTVPFKTCTCCRRAISQKEWTQLRYVGVQADEVEALELRDCDCGSTLSVVTRSAHETVRLPIWTRVAA